MAHERRRRRVLIVSIINAALVAALIAVRELLPEGAPAAFVVVYAPQWVWLIIPALCVGLGLWRRSWGVTALNVAVAGLAAMALAGFEYPRGCPEHPQPARHSLRVVTWNVHEAHHAVEGIERRLLAFDADVVALQEASHAAFDDILPGHAQARVEGLRIYSRLPMLASHHVAPPAHGYRPLLVADLETPGGPLTVFAVHLLTARPLESLRVHEGSLPTFFRNAVAARELQFEHLARRLPGARPVLVCGDFNTPPRSRINRHLSERLTDAFAATRFGLGLTYLIGKRVPAWRIDYVWCGNGVRPVRCRVGPAHPSDHRPLVVEVVTP